MIKNTIVYFFLLMHILTLKATDQGILLDRLVAVIYDDDETIVITKADLERTTIDGRHLTPKEWLVQWLVYLDAKKYKIEYSEDDVDKALASVQKENGLTLDSLKNIFKAAGYPFEEARHQLGVMRVVQSRIEFELLSKDVNKVPQDAITAYYNEHPIEVEKAYTISRGSTPLKNDSVDDQKEELKSKLAEGNMNAVFWQPEYTILDSELSSTSFIRTLDIGQVSEPQVANKRLEVVRLVDKVEAHLVPLKDREEEIKQSLRQEIIARVIENFKERVLKESLQSGYLEIVDEQLKEELASKEA